MKPLLASCLLIASVAAYGYGPFFVPNQGQWEGAFAYRCEIGHATYFVTGTGLTIDLKQYGGQGVLASGRLGSSSAVGAGCIAPERSGFEEMPRLVRGHVLKLNFVNANHAPETLGEDKISSYSNYFFGRDSCQWRSRVPHYQKVVLKDVWPGIDVELVATEQGVETVYHVAPFSDPAQIQIEVEGLESPLSVDANGSVLFPTSLGTLTEQAPFAYQQAGHVQKSVGVHYRLLSSSRYALDLPAYDPEKEVVIDPLLYGSYLGGFGPDDIDEIDIGTDSTVVVCGVTQTDNFPTTPGAYQEQFDPQGGAQGFASKFSPHGDTLLFSTYLASIQGQSYMEEIIETDSGIYVAGITESGNFPVTPDAFQAEFGGGNNDAVFLRLSLDGTHLDYSTYLGGSLSEQPFALSPGQAGLLFLGGGTASLNFPTLPGALYPNADPNYGDGFFGVVREDDLAFTYLSYIAGNGDEWVIDIQDLGNGDTWTGMSTRSSNLPTTPGAFDSTNSGERDAYVLQWNYQTNLVSYASYLGGDRIDVLTGISPTALGRVAVAGSTNSYDFPTTSGAWDTVRNAGTAGYVAILDPEQGLVASTLLEGNNVGGADYIAERPDVGQLGITVAGETNSSDFPVTPGAFDTIFNGNGQWNGGDAFVARLSLDLTTLAYGTFLGGASVDQGISDAFASHDRVWVVGNTGSDDLPVTPNAVQPTPGGIGDGFIFCFEIPVVQTVARDFTPHPTSFFLSVYPNPFNPNTTVTFSLPQREHVSLQVVDVLGRQVLSLNWGILEAGSHHQVFDGTRLPSGMYVMRLQAGTQTTAAKIVMMR